MDAITHGTAEAAQPKGSFSDVWRLQNSVPGMRWYRLELVGISFVVNLFALALPIFILQLYDRVLPNEGMTTMQFLAVGLVVVVILDGVMKLARSFVSTWNGARFEHLARVTAVQRVLRTRTDRYERETPGTFFDRIHSLSAVKEFYATNIATLMIDIPFALMFLLLIWYLGGTLVLAPIVLITIFSILAFIIGAALRKSVAQRSALDNKRYDFMIEIIRGIQTVKALALKPLMQRRFEQLQEHSAKAVHDVALNSSLAQGIGALFSQLNMVTVIGVGAIMVLDGSLSAGELAACTLLSGRAMQPLQSAMGLWTSFQTIRVAGARAAEVMNLPDESPEDLPELPEIEGEVELQNVQFSYDGNQPYFIDGMNLHLKAGEVIGIEGDNSSGRSTLLLLMMGMLRPQGGRVLIDGHDLAHYRPESIRQQVAYLAQGSEVYSGTIIDNLTNFRDGPIIQKAISMAAELGIDDQVKRMPDGYDTNVGDGAAEMLPRGFRQRLAIVRALVDEPRVILFDEANQGLDAQSDTLLRKLLENLKGKSTIVIISHRPALLRISDRRFTMEDGKLGPWVDTYAQQAPAKAPNKPSSPPPAPPTAPPLAPPGAASQEPSPKAPSATKARPSVQKPAPLETTPRSDFGQASPSQTRPPVASTRMATPPKAAPQVADPKPASESTPGKRPSIQAPAPQAPAPRSEKASGGGSQPVQSAAPQRPGAAALRAAQASATKAKGSGPQPAQPVKAAPGQSTAGHSPGPSKGPKISASSAPVKPRPVARRPAAPPTASGPGKGGSSS